MNETNDLCEFGGFKFDLARNTLWRENKVVALSPKSLELLKLLVRKNGEVVSKEEIFDTVWAGTFVEDGVLTQNIYILRQTLGKDLGGKKVIENIARRGYRFTAPVSWIGVAAQAETETTEQQHPPLPASSIYEPEKRWRLSLILPAIAVIGSLFAAIAVGYLLFWPKGLESSDTSVSALKFTRLTDKGDVSYLAISPDGSKVAYTRGFEVHVRDLEKGTEAKVNIEGAGKVGCIQFANDGRTLYYGTVFNRDERGSVFGVDIEGGKPVPVATDVWTGFSISPDGQEMAFVRKIPAENGQVLVRKRLDSGEEQVEPGTKLPEEFYWNNYPAWSADGRRIALVAVNQTEHLSRIVIFENGKTTDLRPDGFRNIEQVVWTADGSGFLASGNDGETFQVWRISLDDGTSRRITNDLNSYLGIAVSLDRKHLVSRQRIYYSNIWVGMKDDLSNLTQMTEGTGRNDGLYGLAWIDEDRIVYATNDERIRDWNLWVLNTADGSHRKLTNDIDVQNDLPAVSADRRTVYFASDRNKQRRIWRVGVDGGEPEQVTFGEDETHQFPQLSPDGKYLYFIIKSGRTSNIGRASLLERSVQELSGKTKFVPGNFLQLSPDGKYLAFQNISDAPATRDGPTDLQVAVLSTDDPDNVQLVDIGAFRPGLQWSVDGGSFDFIGGDVKESVLLRRSLFVEGPPIQLSPRSRDSIFNFAWSPSGERIAVSQGQLLRDVILLSDLEK